MLYPDFDELVKLRARASSGNLLFKQKVKSSMTGDYLSSFRGNGMEFDEVRRYVVGDDIRKIDWRITARVGEPHIKLFKEERHLNVMISVDMNSHMRFGTRGTFKSVQAANCASILAWSINNNSDSVGAYLFGDIAGGDKFFRPKRSRYSIWQMIKTLSEPNETNNQNKTSLAKSADFLHQSVQSGSLVFIISDFLNIDDKFEEQLGYLSRRSKVVLISVNDPSDIDIPPIGNILFTNEENQKLQISTNSDAGRDNYQEQWKKNRERLKKIIENLGVRVVTIMTNEDAYDNLFYGLNAKYNG